MYLKATWKPLLHNLVERSALFQLIFNLPSLDRLLPSSQTLHSCLHFSSGFSLAKNQDNSRCFFRWEEKKRDCYLFSELHKSSCIDRFINAICLLPQSILIFLSSFRDKVEAGCAISIFLSFAQPFYVWSCFFAASRCSLTRLQGDSHREENKRALHSWFRREDFYCRLAPCCGISSTDAFPCPSQRRELPTGCFKKIVVGTLNSLQGCPMPSRYSNNPRKTWVHRCSRILYDVFGEFLSKVRPANSDHKHKFRIIPTRDYRVFDPSSISVHSLGTSCSRGYRTVTEIWTRFMKGLMLSGQSTLIAKLPFTIDESHQERPLFLCFPFVYPSPSINSAFANFGE